MESPSNQSPHSQTLLALAVFQGLCKPDYVRSIHLYEHCGTVISIQQEFLFSPGAFSRISHPIPCAYIPNFSLSGLKELMVKLKKLHENDCWKCILEFHSDSPANTSMMPLLSVSRNPSLKDIPSLAHDLGLVERAVEAKRDSEIVVGSSSYHIFDIKDETSSKDASRSPWNLANWTLPPLSASPLVDTQEHLHDVQAVDGSDRTIQSLQLDIWHEWGSYLELASPRVPETFDLDSWRTSICEPPSLQYTANLSASSPTSSCFTSHNPDVASLHQLFAMKSHIVQDFHLEDPPITSYSMLSTVQTLSSGETFISGLVSKQNPAALVKYDEQHTFSADSPGRSSQNFMKNLGQVIEGSATYVLLKGDEIDGTRSMYSDESVGTGGECDKPGKGLTLLSLPSQACRVKAEDFLNGRLQESLEFPSPTSSDVYLDGGAGKACRRSCTGSEGQSAHHRGSSERMTEITISQLSQYFNMPITQASKELKVGLTVLKKRCREFGIPRWPHRKMKSLDSLIQNIQDLASDEGGKTAARVLNAVKELEEQKKQMEEMPGTELAEKTKRLRQACFKASYKKRRQMAQPVAHQEPCDDDETEMGFPAVIFSDMCVSSHAPGPYHHQIFR